jgi:uncharacterized membrane protein (UPF0127 family)
MARLTTCTALLLLLVHLCGCTSTPRTHASITVAGEAWIMELALGKDAIERGLMERDTLEPGTGMLFVFPDVRERQFWMAWCSMPIDVIFLDGRGRIVATHAMPLEPPQQPGEAQWAYLDRMPSYASGVPARFAVEFPAGTIERLALQRGDRVELDIERLLEDERRQP